MQTIDLLLMYVSWQIYKLQFQINRISLRELSNLEFIYFLEYQYEQQ